MGGGNSHDRARRRKANERWIGQVKNEVVQELKDEMLSATIPASQAKDPTLLQKLGRFWTSTPAWGGIGMLAGPWIARLSVYIAYGLAWALLFGECLRVKFFTRRQVLGNALLGVLIAVCLLLCLWVTPKPKDPPSLDQQVELQWTAFAKKFPWLAKPPKEVNTPNSPKPDRPKIDVGSDTRAFLRSVPIDTSVDKVGHDITVKVITANIGALDALPHATIFGFIRFRERLTEGQENSLFDTFNLGGGRGTWNRNRSTYWPRGDSQIFEIQGSPEFVEPADFDRNWDEVSQGTLLAYVFVRHIYKDKIGNMLTESCAILRGPDFNEWSPCLTHSGPRTKPFPKENS